MLARRPGMRMQLLDGSGSAKANQCLLVQCKARVKPLAGCTTMARPGTSGDGVKERGGSALHKQR